MIEMKFTKRIWRRKKPKSPLLFDRHPTPLRYRLKWLRFLRPQDSVWTPYWRRHMPLSTINTRINDFESSSSSIFFPKKCKLVSFDSFESYFAHVPVDTTAEENQIWILVGCVKRPLQYTLNSAIHLPFFWNNKKKNLFNNSRASCIWPIMHSDTALCW